MKKQKQLISIFISTVLILLLCFSGLPPKTQAATITLYPKQYSYVKPAPYWTASPCDEFSAAQQVTILERDYDFFYVQYTRNGQLRRGYIAMTCFNEADYSGYSWCVHTHFTTGYNNTGTSKTTYYSPTTNSSAGSIDADEGIASTKPLLVLRYEGNRAFVQYVTNPGATSHPLYKRAWVDKAAITLTPPTSTIDNNTFVLIKNNSTGKYLEVAYVNSEYVLREADSTGNYQQQWKLISVYTAEGGHYYKIYNPVNNLAIEIDGKIPVLGAVAKLTPLNSPNKAQEFHIDVKNTVAGTLGGILSKTGYISTRCSGNFMVLQSGNSIQQQLKTSSANQQWTFEYMYRHFDFSYENLTYSNGKAVIPYHIDTSSLNSINVSESSVLNAITNWNNIGANVTFSRTTSQNSSKVRIKAADLEDAALGYLSPNTGFVNSVWTYSTLKINSNKDSGNINAVYNLLDSEKQMILCHELGHALKLMHPYGEGASETDHVVRSVMNQGLPKYSVYVLYNPSQYDAQSLKNKWGG